MRQFSKINNLSGMNKNIAFLIFLVAYGLLYPGLTQPLLSITAVIEKAGIAQMGKDIIVENPDTPEIIGAMAQALVDNMQLTGTVVAYEKTRSIIGTIQELFENQHVLVAVLIGLFSIVVPLIKALILITSQLKILPNSAGLQRFSGAISKWSMADVFVMAVLVAYLAANAVDKEAGLMSFHATLGSGFYFFLGYCILSILASQILSSSKNHNTNNA